MKLLLFKASWLVFFLLLLLHPFGQMSPFSQLELARFRSSTTIGNWGKWRHFYDLTFSKWNTVDSSNDDGTRELVTNDSFLFSPFLLPSLSLFIRATAMYTLGLFFFYISMLFLLFPNRKEREKNAKVLACALVLGLIAHFNGLCLFSFWFVCQYTYRAAYISGLLQQLLPFLRSPTNSQMDHHHRIVFLVEENSLHIRLIRLGRLKAVAVCTQNGPTIRFRSNKKEACSNVESERWWFFRIDTAPFTLIVALLLKISNLSVCFAVSMPGKIRRSDQLLTPIPISIALAVRLSDWNAVTSTAAAAAAPSLLAYGDYEGGKVDLIAGANMAISSLTFDRPQRQQSSPILIQKRMKTKISMLNFEFLFVLFFFQKMEETFIFVGLKKKTKQRWQGDKIGNGLFVSASLEWIKLLLPLFSSRQASVFLWIGARSKPLVYLLKNVARGDWAREMLFTVRSSGPTLFYYHYYY